MSFEDCSDDPSGLPYWDSVYRSTFIYPGRMFRVSENEVPHLPAVLDGLSCTGKETSLLDCCHIGGRHNCYYTIGIECAGSYYM